MKSYVYFQIGAVCAIISSCLIAQAEDEEIIVSATRTEHGIKDIPAQVHVIDREAIEASGATTVDQLFRTVVGVDLQGSGLPGAEIKLNMRGLTPGFQSKRVLVMIDGRRINEQYQGNVDFTLIPASNIERIEVVKGPASALYGSNAQGGVINIITRKGSSGAKYGRKMVTSVKAAAGDFGTQDYRISQGGVEGSVDYRVSAGYVTTDGYMDNSDGTDRDWTAWNADADMGIALGELTDIRLDTGYYEGSGVDENSDRTVEKNYISAVGRHNWDPDVDADFLARIYRNGEDNEYDWKYPGVGIYEQETLAGEVQQSYRVNDGNLFTFGSEVRRESVKVDEVQQSIDQDSTTVGGYVQDEIILTDDVLFTLGVRGDNESDFGSEWSPRAGAIWHVTDKAELYGSFNRAHRAPGLSDRYVLVDYNGLTFEGNPDLKPETLTAYEFGGRSKVGGSVDVDLCLFYNDLEDSFDFMLDSDGVFRNQNVTASSIFGVEAEVKVGINDGISLFANYSLMDGEYDSFESNPAVEGNELAYLAENKAAAGVNLVCPYGSTAILQARYVGERYGDPQNTEENLMEDYVVADISLRVAVCKTAAVTLNVDNVLDETYQEFPTYDQPGRMFMAGVDMVF